MRISSIYFLISADTIYYRDRVTKRGEINHMMSRLDKLIPIFALLLLSMIAYQNCMEGDLKLSQEFSNYVTNGPQNNNSPAPTPTPEPAPAPTPDVSDQGTFARVLNQVDPNSDAYLNSSVELSNGNIISIGRRFDLDQDAFVMSTNNSGAPIWAISIEGGDDDQLFDIVKLPDDSVVVSGLAFSFFQGATRNGDVYLARISAAGQLIWSKNLGTADYEEGFALDVKGNDIYIAGRLRTAADLNVMSGLIMKVDQNGALQWSNTYGGLQASQTFRQITVDQDGEVWVTGLLRDAGTQTQAVALQINEDDGAVLQGIAFDGPAANFELPWAIEKLEDGQLVLGGLISNGPFGDNDAFLLKHDLVNNSSLATVFGTADSDVIRGITKEKEGQMGFIFRSSTLQGSPSPDSDVYFGEVNTNDLSRNFLRGLAGIDEEMTDQHPIIRLQNGAYLATLSTQSLTPGNSLHQPMLVRMSSSGDFTSSCGSLPDYNISEQPISFTSAPINVTVTPLNAVSTDHTASVTTANLALNNSLICGE
jgi:hypothetical protein